MKHYRGFELPNGPKFRAWTERLFNHPSFKGTCSTEELYLDSYERCALSSPVPPQPSLTSGPICCQVRTQSAEYEPGRRCDQLRTRAALNHALSKFPLPMPVPRGPNVAVVCDRRDQLLFYRTAVLPPLLACDDALSL